jgi:hypothetical protein
MPKGKKNSIDAVSAKFKEALQSLTRLLDDSTNTADMIRETLEEAADEIGTALDKERPPVAARMLAAESPAEDMPKKSKKPKK